MAAKLAPLMDASLITLEGTMNQGNCESTSIAFFVLFVIVFFSAQVQLLLVCVSGQ